MSALDNARIAWGTHAPEWIVALARECDRLSQRAVAVRLGYSPASLSMLLNGRYKADLTAIEQAVRGALMSATVDCPVAGQLASDVCLKNQKLPFAATNLTRVRLYKACRNGCAHSRLGKGA